MPLFVARLIALAVCSMTVTAVAHAQSFPSKPVRMLVGFPAGGPSDVPARIIAQQMQAALGQPVVVENKTGAAGIPWTCVDPAGRLGRLTRTAPLRGHARALDLVNGHPGSLNT